MKTPYIRGYIDREEEEAIALLVDLAKEDRAPASLRRAALQIAAPLLIDKEIASRRGLFGLRQESQEEIRRGDAYANELMENTRAILDSLPQAFRTPEFQCRGDFDVCVKTGGSASACWPLYILCLARCLTSAVIPKISV